MTLPTTENQDHADQQIFHSSPTRSDMIELAQQAQAAKRDRARYFVFAVFLAGIALAAGAGLVVLYSQMLAQVSAVEAQRDEQIELVQEKDETIAQRDQTILEQKQVIDSFGDFQSVKVLQDQSAELEAQIAALLAESSRQNAPSKLKELPEAVEWMDGTVTKLRERRDALQKLKSEVEAWPPPVQNPRPD